MKKALLFLVLLMLGTDAFSEKCRVTLKAPADVTVRVYREFGDTVSVGDPVLEKKTLFGGKVKRVFELEEGKYHFVASGEGYYTLQKNFLAVKGRRVDADPGRKGSAGYAPEKVYALTDETFANAMDLKALSRKYPWALRTPGMNRKKPFQEHTTQEEIESFLVKMDRKRDDMYLFKVGQTTLGKDLFLAVFSKTDLRGKSLEEAGAALVGNGRPTVYLHAQIHGNEPSPCDGALAMAAALHGRYGRKVLPNVNVIILPRVNGDGAQAWTRGTSVAPDMNRDNLLCANPEVKATHRVYNLFLPDVVVDMHEYGTWRNVTRDDGFLDDAGITVSGNQNNTAELNDLMKEMMRHVESAGAEEGLRYWEYTQGGYSDQAPLHASHYYALRGSTNFLVETPNASVDRRATFGRRVMTHFFAAKALIDFTIANSERLRATVAADREATVACGRDGSNPLILKHGQNEEAYRYSRKFFEFEKGAVLCDSLFSVRYYEVPLVERDRPAAYLIPKDVAEAERILEIMSLNGIAWAEIPAGTELSLRAYLPGEEGDKYHLDILAPEQFWQFSEGAYVFHMDQPSAHVLAMLMEPDFCKTDKYPISLVQAGLLQREEVFRQEFPPLSK